MDKEQKIQEKGVHIAPSKEWRKAYIRYNRIYTLIVLVYIAVVCTVWYYFGKFYGVSALIFGLWSWYWYEDGASENCIDEYEYAYPKDGFRRMFKSWPWFVIPLYVIYQLCK